MADDILWYRDLPPKGGRPAHVVKVNVNPQPSDWEFLRDRAYSQVQEFISARQNEIAGYLQQLGSGRMWEGKYEYVDYHNQGYRMRGRTAVCDFGTYVAVRIWANMRDTNRVSSDKTLIVIPAHRDHNTAYTDVALDFPKHRPLLQKAVANLFPGYNGAVAFSLAGDGTTKGLLDNMVREYQRTWIRVIARWTSDRAARSTFLLIRLRKQRPMVLAHGLVSTRCT